MAESQLTTEQQVMSMWKLGGLKPLELGKRVWREIDHDNILGRASELAYNFLIAIFPLLLVLLTILGMFASRGTQLRDTLFTGLASVVPGSAWDLVSKTLNEVINSSGGGKLTFGIVLTLWSASAGTSTMISALNEAYHIRDRRPWWKVRLIAIGLTLAISLLVLSALVVVLFGNHIAASLGAKFGLGDVVVIGWKVVQWIAALFFVSLAFALVYYFGPDVEEQHWYWITPGSFIGVGLWLAASFGFRVYLHFFNTYSKTYGSLGTVIILLLWFYITGLAFLVGGEINSEIEQAAAHRGHPEAKAEGERVAA
jgi:membrane protein